MRFILSETLILTAYPLSASFDRAIKAVFGNQGRVVTVAQLAAEGMLGMLRQLWNMRGDPVALPIEEGNSAALLPLLKLLAACSRSRSICVVRPDLSREAVSRWRIAREMVSFLTASVAGLWAACRAKRELTRLLAEPRAAARALPDGGAILYLKTNLWFGIKAGGSVGHIAGVVNGLQRLGHPVTFASAEPPVMIDQEVRLLDVRPPAAFGVPFELNNYRFQRSFEAVLADSTARGTAQLIYQRLSAANYVGVVLSRRYRMPLVVEYNGSEVWVAKNWGRGMRFHRLAERAEDAMLRHAHLIVTVSDVLKDELVERGVERERIVSYPNCIDPKVFNPTRFNDETLARLRSDLQIPPGSLVTTFVGTFGQWHGADKWAEAIARMYINKRAWLQDNRLHFLFVGDGLTRPKVQELIARAAANAVCTFTGLVPQALAPLYLAASDILVSPHVPNADGSRFFGSPTKLFEYMAMGKPILASDLDQIGEVLAPGLIPSDAGTDLSFAGDARAMLVRPGDVGELVRGLETLVSSARLRDTLGRNARQAALDHFTWDTHVKKILEGLRLVTK
jgi:glycosyltransferase involved in cell wall biosynthesis